MAHFAQLDDAGRVIQTVAVSNTITFDENGIEHEQLGVDFCKGLFGEQTTWVQFSVNGSIRGRVPHLGDLYDSVLDEFTSPIPAE